MEVYQNVRSMIGNTPLLELTCFDLPPKVRIFAKLELMNPGGSVKDRVGLYMVRDALEKGILREGGTIVDATAGNTGIGIAIAALRLNCHVVFTVPEKFSVEKQMIMQALGARIVHTPREEGMLGAAREAERIRRETEGAVSLDQFRNPSNPLAHYETTGPEIYRQMDGQIQYFTAGAGSGGTYSGIMRYLRERDPGIRGVLADPEGSVIGGGRHADYNIEGIGNDFIPETMDLSFVDQVMKVTDEEAFEAVRILAAREGILAGSSSGAALASALKLAEQIGEGNIVTVFPDRGDRYLSKHLYAGTIPAASL